MKRTLVLTMADEDKLWTTGVLSLDTPRGISSHCPLLQWEEFLLERGRRTERAEILTIEEKHCHGEWRTKSVL